MVLCETKAKSPPTSSKVGSCGFSYFVEVPTLGLSGGLWILWKDCVTNPFKFTIIYKSNRSISCLISFNDYSLDFVVLFVYAPPNIEQKADF